jgi:hypothetical protein
MKNTVTRAQAHAAAVICLQVAAVVLLVLIVLRALGVI